MFKRLPTLLSATVFALAVSAGAAHAASIAYTIDNVTGQTLQNPPFTLGFQFTANIDMTVISLGLFDSSQDGLVESHAAGIWDSGGTLLGSTVIPSGVAGTLVNQFRYVATSISLLAGQNYFIGALYLTGSDPLIFPGFASNFATDPGVTFLQSQFAGGAVLTFPSLTAGQDPAYFGPNFQFEAVPEPASMAMLAIGGAGVWFRRRQKR
jgi:hypothetical protein